jgi:hypothetical protein
MKVMKQKNVFLFMFLFVLSMGLKAQQDTIVAWTFPTGNLTDSVADAGLPMNLSNTIRAEGGAGPLAMITGDVTHAIQAVNWDNGDNSKFWSIKFKAEGYENLMLYSVQKSDAADFGPRDWKVQYKLGGSGTWTDVTGGTITGDNTWSGAVVTALPIPVTNQGSTSIFVRWLMTSNTATDGNPVLATGKSAIDQIVVFGTPETPPMTGDTITGWDFSDDTDIEFNANLGLVSNHGYDIRAEDTTGTTRPLTYTNGATNFAATASDWDNGTDNKFWSIKFKADGYTSMKVYSKQYSGDTNPGPKYWKIQARKSGEDWLDVTGGDVTVENNWTTGVADGLDLPAALDLPGTSSLFVRWIMTSNESTGGSDVLPAGVAKIDDIIITGLNVAGVETVIFENNVTVYPNPTADFLNIESLEELETVRIFDLRGLLVMSEKIGGYHTQLDLRLLAPGLYIVTMQFYNEAKLETRKIIVE